MIHLVWLLVIDERNLAALNLHIWAVNWAWLGLLCWSTGSIGSVVSLAQVGIESSVSIGHFHVVIVEIVLGACHDVRTLVFYYFRG